jgi:hypothetical protein
MPGGPDEDLREPERTASKRLLRVLEKLLACARAALCVRRDARQHAWVENDHAGQSIPKSPEVPRLIAAGQDAADWSDRCTAALEPSSRSPSITAVALLDQAKQQLLLGGDLEPALRGVSRLGELDGRRDHGSRQPARLRVVLPCGARGPSSSPVAGTRVPPDALLAGRC